MLRAIRSFSNPIQDNAQLCQRLQASDRGAFSALFQEMHEALLRYAWQVTQDEAAAQDVVQEAFVKLWQVRMDLDTEKSIRGLLYTIVRNRALNHRRTPLFDATPLEYVENGIPDESIMPEANLDAETLQAKLRQWISELPARRREAFELSRYHGLSHDEISQMMALSPATVNRHIVLALQTLRDRLKQFAPEWSAYVTSES